MLVVWHSSLASKIGIATRRTIVLSSSSGAVLRDVSMHRSWTTSSTVCLPLLLLDAMELRERAGVVKNDEALEGSSTGGCR